MNDIDRRPRLHRLVLLLSVMGAASLRGQDPRDAMVARAFNEFDAARRLQLLMSALNPTSGPPRGAWPVGVQLLAQTTPPPAPILAHNGIPPFFSGGGATGVCAGDRIAGGGFTTA